MANCHYCGEKKIRYKCKDCGNSFCFDHTGSTDIFTCKKHPDTYLSRKDYSLQDRKCQVLNSSKCPQCNSEVRVAYLQNDNKYIQCTSCSWNSLEDSPKIISKNINDVFQEGIKHKISTKINICDKKLKYDKGREFCYYCFIDYLEKSREVLFSDLKQDFGFDHLNAQLTLDFLLRENLVEGILDKKKSLFVYLNKKEKAKILETLQNQGFLVLEGMQQRLRIRPTTAMQIVIQLIREKSFRGTFTKDKSKYYLEGSLTKFLLKEIKQHGRVKHSELAKKYQVYEQNIKNYIMNNILKAQMISAYFAEHGNSTVLTSTIEDEIEDFCKKKGEFHLNALGSQLGIATELARKILFGLIQKGQIRGIFTQNKEFITEDKLIEKIKRAARAYKQSPLAELSRQFAVTERKVEEMLTILISRGSVAGYIDRENQMFLADKEQPITKFGKFSQSGSQSSSNQANNAHLQPSSAQEGNIQVVRQYDFVGGQLHFKVVVRNMSKMAIHDIKVVLDVPSSYRKARELISIPVIDPSNTHGVDFYLEPKECGISSIGGTVIYKDAMGQTHSIHVSKKEVQIKCPLVIATLDTIEDCQKAIQSLPSDARAFLISDLPAQMAYSAAYRAVSKFDTRNVASYENDKKSFEAEAWFSSEAKVTGGRIIIRVYFNGANSTLEIRVWCNDAGQLTGLLAKIIELFFNEINLMRQIKAEERNKTIDVMTITRDLMEISDVCMLRYKAINARLKLEDIHTRLQRIGVKEEDVLQRIYDWIKKLEEHYPEDEDMLSEEDGDRLDQDIQSIHQVLKNAIGA